MAPLTHHPFVSKSQAPGGWNLLQQVAPLTHRAPVTHHRTVVGTCHWWVGGRRPNSLEYQICTAPEPFDTLVTGLPLEDEQKLRPKASKHPQVAPDVQFVTGTTSSAGVKILSLVKFHTRSDNRRNTITLRKLISFLNLKVKCCDVRNFWGKF